ncbi:N-acetylglucosamine-6-phosphate deacetylase [Caldisericum sp.]|jgi:N-acetylglucosamine-6-phosphate deacetylase|uniref:N-acetylglucosamine-6-phosphate deacetylase n=1 Tax=Caldisericum sp. TaxID=2499687 RepID=UPI003CB8251C
MSLVNDDKDYYIKTDNLYVPEKVEGEAFLHISDGKIVEILYSKPTDELDILDLTGFIVGPGFVDVHIHGYGGHDSIEGSFDAIQSIALGLSSRGVTAFLPTTTANFVDNLKKIVSVSLEFDKIKGARPLGFHLEGPFLSKSEPGAMDPNLFETPSIGKVKELIESGIIRMMTIAPELDNALEVISFLYKNGVAIALGHSATDFETATKAFIHGSNSITHFFNAMPQFHHRSPSLIGAGFVYPFYLQFIADGVHTHHSTIRIVTKYLKDRLVLITDAIMAAGLDKPGVYRLGDFDIIVDNISARLSNGTLAGSILTMDKGFRNLVNIGELSISEAFKCASTNPCLSIGETGRGAIREGNFADFVVLTKDELSVYITIREGKIVYERRRS